MVESLLQSLGKKRFSFFSHSRYGGIRGEREGEEKRTHFSPPPPPPPPLECKQYNEVYFDNGEKGNAGEVAESRKLFLLFTMFQMELMTRTFKLCKKTANLWHEEFASC